MAGQNVDTFITKYRDAAQKVADEMGIPVERVLAQAGLETGWNTNAPGNNLFGVKADPSWTGKSQQLDTKEDFGRGLVGIKQPFRVYDNPEDSFRDWAKVLKQDNYKAAMQPGIPDAEYAQALKDGGYATDPDYAKKLTGTIADTRQAMFGQSGNQPPAELPPPVNIPGGGVLSNDPAQPDPNAVPAPFNAASAGDPTAGIAAANAGKPQWWQTMGQAGKSLMAQGQAPQAPTGLLSAQAHKPNPQAINFLQSIFG